MEVSVVGGGPGGSWAAILLARRGHAVTLFDPQAPWEKPCGGGVTSRALERFDIFSGDLPRKKIEEITLFFGDQNSVKVVPERPLVIVSRKELGESLLNEAKRCGCKCFKSGSPVFSETRGDGACRRRHELWNPTSS